MDFASFRLWYVAAWLLAAGLFEPSLPWAFAQSAQPAGASLAAPTEGSEESLPLAGGGRYEYANRRLVVPGRVCLQKGLIELFACARRGKEHESVLVLDCDPQELHLALTLMGLRDKREFGNVGPQYLGDPTVPKGDRVVVEVSWHEEGERRLYRAEDLILTGPPEYTTTMEPVGWVFSGSEFIDEVDWETGKPTGRQIYLARSTRSLITTYHDPTSILDNPLPEGGDDTLYLANFRVLPAPGTPVEVAVRAARAEELEKAAPIVKAAIERFKEMLRRLEQQAARESGSQPPAGEENSSEENDGDE